jgi:gamma-glutamyl hercynylcysteine S-oxide synthase
MATPALAGPALLVRFDRVRARSRAIFDLVADEAYYIRPISLRHPIVFYEGHLSAFAVNALLKNALGEKGIDDHLETLFARGIDPESEAKAADRRVAVWPSRRDVQAYTVEADRRLRAAYQHADLDRPGDPLLDRGEAAFAIIEHEEMHQETLLYMWHRLPFSHKRRPVGYRPEVDASRVAGPPVRIPAGEARLGAAREDLEFGWDNEFPACAVHVPAFEIDLNDVTNGDYLEFVGAGGYDDPRWWSESDWAWRRDAAMSHPLFWERHEGQWFWRGMFDLIPLPESWPVYVSHAEASAYARWRGERLPTEAEFHRAAYGSPDGRPRRYPWGNDDFDPVCGNLDFTSWDPVPAGARPRGASAWGVHDLTSNGWKWTSTVFAPFPGFRAMGSYPEYSTDFFDGEHYVMKGASPATSRDLLRPSFRNWFRPHYPYVYATFRLVKGREAAGGYSA